jgi:pyruvate ferredoxin oxidoreductase alpha subunit
MDAATKSLDGNSAIAEAVKQTAVDVVVAHPSAPAAGIIEQIARLAANGQMDSELVNVESAESAISGCIGASAAGGRVFTATASQELSAMQEVLFIAASLRLPLVAGITSRALAAPLNTSADHSDTMAQQSCGWIQLYCDSPQEAYDTIIQAYKIAEHADVRTPVMVALDAELTSNCGEEIHIEDDNGISEFVGKFNCPYSLLDSEHPVTAGFSAMQNYYFEHKINQLQGIENSRKIIKEIGKEFGDRFGRYYGNFESYKLEDADFALVLIGSAVAAAKQTVDRLRSQGEKAGVLKLRVFRPFPDQELRDTLSGLKAIAVLDRSFSPGAAGGPLAREIRSALYNGGSEKKPRVFPYVYGLGGRDIQSPHLEDVFKEIKKKFETNEINSDVGFVNLRESR